jgi:uncharacterized membrane protein HdeD (DUF308 family)
MVRPYARNWWLLALRGVAAIIFGVLAFIVPGITLFVLVTLFGAYALIDGILAITNALRHRDENRQWWVLLLEGLVGVLVGIATFLWPGLTGLTLLYLIAVYAVFTGILEIIAAIQLRRELHNEWALILSGAISIILGVLLMTNPGAGAVGLIWAIGIYAIFFGILMLVLALRVRRNPHQLAI